jgi:hypothetical protein
MDEFDLCRIADKRNRQTFRFTSHGLAHRRAEADAQNPLTRASTPFVRAAAPGRHWSDGARFISHVTSDPAHGKKPRGVRTLLKTHTCARLAGLRVRVAKALVKYLGFAMKQPFDKPND